MKSLKWRLFRVKGWFVCQYAGIALKLSDKKKVFGERIRAWREQSWGMKLTHIAIWSAVSTVLLLLLSALVSGLPPALIFLSWAVVMLAVALTAFHFGQQLLRIDPLGLGRDQIDQGN